MKWLESFNFDAEATGYMDMVNFMSLRTILHQILHHFPPQIIQSRFFALDCTLSPKLPPPSPLPKRFMSPHMPPSKP